MDLSIGASEQRRVRNEAAGNDNGKLTLDLRPPLKRIEDGELFDPGSILGWILNPIVNLGGFIWRGLVSLGSGIASLFSNINSLGGWWQALTQGVQQLFFFDWNKTDEQIDQAIAGTFNQSAEAIGEWLGFTVCGAANIGASMLIPKIGPVVAKFATREFLPEVWGEFKGAMRIVFTGLANAAGLALYKNVRAWLKTLAPIMPDPIKNFLNSWGDGKEPWTMFGAVEKAIDGIPNETLKNFAQGALEGCFEGWAEAGMIVGDNIDGVLASIAANQNVTDEQMVTVEVDLAKGSGNFEDTTLGGKLAVQAPAGQIEQKVADVVATKQVLGLNTVGLMLGQPAEDFVAATIRRRQLQLNFYKGVSKPPWRTNNGAASQVSVTIPNPKKGLTWLNLRAAMRRWTWGRFKAMALLDSGRKIVVYASTSNGAEAKVRELLTLTDDELVAIDVLEEKERNAQIRKNPTLVYPARGILLVRRPSDTLEGRTDVRGNRWIEEPVAFEMWTDSKPSNFPVLL